MPDVQKSKRYELRRNEGNAFRHFVASPSTKYQISWQTLFLRPLGLCEHCFIIVFNKKVCAHKQNRCKNFSYFFKNFSKMCLMFKNPSHMSSGETREICSDILYPPHRKKISNRLADTIFETFGSL